MFLLVGCSSNSFKKLDKLPGSKVDLSLDGCLDFCLRQNRIVYSYGINDSLNQSECHCSPDIKP